VDIAHFQLSVDFSLGFAFSVHGAALFFSAFSLFPLLFCAPVAHWDAYGYACGTALCISWYQI